MLAELEVAVLVLDVALVAEDVSVRTRGADVSHGSTAAFEEVEWRGGGMFT